MLQGVLQVLQGVSGAKGGHGMQGSYELFSRLPTPYLNTFIFDLFHIFHFRV